MGQFDLDSADGLQVVEESINYAVETTLSVNTTPQVVKVGGSNLENRIYVFIQPAGQNVKWGFSTSCVFSVPKDASVWIPVNDGQNVYLKTTAGTVNVAVAEAS